MFCLTLFHPPACSFTKSLSFSGCPCQPLIISSNQYLYCTAVRDLFAFNSSFSHNNQATKMLCLLQKIPSRYIKKENVSCVCIYDEFMYSSLRARQCSHFTLLGCVWSVTAVRVRVHTEPSSRSEPSSAVTLWGPLASGSWVQGPHWEGPMVLQTHVCAAIWVSHNTKSQRKT